MYRGTSKVRWPRIALKNDAFWFLKYRGRLTDLTKKHPQAAIHDHDGKIAPHPLLQWTLWTLFGDARYLVLHHFATTHSAFSFCLLHTVLFRFATSHGAFSFCYYARCFFVLTKKHHGNVVFSLYYTRCSRCFFGTPILKLLFIFIRVFLKGWQAKAARNMKKSLPI